MWCFTWMPTTAERYHHGTMLIPHSLGPEHRTCNNTTTTTISLPLPLPRTHLTANGLFRSGLRLQHTANTHVRVHAQPKLHHVFRKGGPQFIFTGERERGGERKSKNAIVACTHRLLLLLLLRLLRHRRRRRCCLHTDVSRRCRCRWLLLLASFSCCSCIGRYGRILNARTQNTYDFYVIYIYHFWCVSICKRIENSRGSRNNFFNFNFLYETNEWISVRLGLYFLRFCAFAYIDAVHLLHFCLFLFYFLFSVWCRR